MIRIGMLVAALAIAACSGNTATAPGTDRSGDDLDTTGEAEEFTLAVGERGAVPEADLAVTFEEVVGDSRCPVDVTCVWQGDGQVAIEIVQAGREFAVTLHTGVEPMAFDVGGWRVRLAGLEPARRDGESIPAESYRATFQVIELGE